MNYSPLELAIIAFIMLGIAIVIWRGGMSNPEGTGTLGRKMATIKSELAEVRTEVKSIDSRVTEIDRRAATIDDVRGLEKKLDAQDRCLAQLDESMTAMRESAASREATLESVRRQVEMIFQVIVPKGMK